MLEVTHRLDKVASILQDRGLLGVASQIDVVANTIEKTAANRRMREYVDERMNKWFPEKARKIKEAMPKVYDEIVDNLAAGILEVAAPGKNKALDDEKLFTFKDEEGKDVGNLIGYLRSTLFFSKLERLPYFASSKAEMLHRLSTDITSKILAYSAQNTIPLEKLQESNGRPNASTLKYILAKVIPSEISYFDATSKTNMKQTIDVSKVSSALSEELAKSSNTVLSGILSGSFKKVPTKEYQDIKQVDKDGVERLWKSRSMYDVMQEVLDNVWTGPVDISLDMSKLSEVLEQHQVNDILGRLHAIKSSHAYKDEERVIGAQSRLPKYPGPSVAWNKNQELIFEKLNDKLLLKEGWHRLMAMIQTLTANHQTKFTVSAYVQKPLDKGLLERGLDKVKKEIAMRSTAP